MKIESAEFITSAADRRGWISESLPEIAIAGRSNVGKSSLINALVRRKRLAKTSGTPGKTQLVNFFRVDDAFILADLPGYGFAKVPLAVKNKWRRLVEEYLRDRDTLRGVIVLVDSRRGLKDMDIDLLDWLAECDLSVCLALTKIDKLKQREIKPAIQALTQTLEAGGPRFGRWSGPILTSAEKGLGRKELTAQIGEWLEAE
ncbi:MAG: YihA family ribosome biogenesis GTP-binding protein [Nitrospinaceae bacterium]|jgi:GTP-binding protein|nr:YihA family ribosome biogenesis GTP-binding protein [Nitrospinaceae bacterium]MBT3432631.1 YihA family ribosome biogenesis GTP-binding protein [Nitrospinaceae bacterium]MBT4094676.1 YihA family ribosome biogenesis GTP-binding protein [Nitrospinaceae bacterium]MBT4430443.1 YihA family ribosome biogenesis GTP-binding protein [Nitrospinaceae bacterium]MBT5366828.1 YihA family ribosome biogenesis GTP-binding protein [Nitrospinaceae bacterium]